jgi:hypothetical protein
MNRPYHCRKTGFSPVHQFCREAFYKIHHSRKLHWFFCLCLLAALNSSCVGTSGASSRAGKTAPLAFSEDFESGKLSTNIWMQMATGGNVIEVQSEKTAHGHYALRVRCPVPSNKTWAFISAQHLPDALRQHHFGRAYMFITPKPPARHTILIMAGTPGFPMNKYEEVAANAGLWQLSYAELRPHGDREDYHHAGIIPVNRWFCLEWEFNDHPDHATVWVDGTLANDTGFVAKATGATNDIIGGFTDFSFGFRLWGAAPEAFDVYYDDIALDTKRIGLLHEFSH